MTSGHPPLFHGLVGLLFRVSGEQLILARLVCLICGTGTLIAVWHSARLLIGREAGLLTVAIVGLIPMRLALSAGTSNENLGTFFSALTLALLAKIARHGITSVRLIALALCLILGFGAKATCLGLFLAALPVLVGRLGRAKTIGFLALCGVGLLGLWSSWALWNRAHYGDWFKKSIAHAYWDERAPGFAVVHAKTGMSLSRYLFGMAATGFRSFWGTFAGMDRPLPLVVYLPLLFWSTAGLYEGVRHRARARRARNWWLGALLFGLFALVVYVGFNCTWFSAQGRYLYGILTPVGLLLARSYLRVFPMSLRPKAGRALVAALLLLNIACLVFYPPWH